MFDDLADLYQQVILDHCRKPRNFHELPAATCSAQGYNPLCGDQLKLYLTMDGDTIRDAALVGSGCCISKASASLLTEAIKGKSRAEAHKMFNQVHELVVSGNAKGELGKLAVFAGVQKGTRPGSSARFSRHRPPGCPQGRRRAGQHRD